MASQQCAHKFLQLWGAAGWHCATCRAHITDADRVARERQHAERAQEEDRVAFRGDPERAAAASHMRGVRVDWLIEWTNLHGCWDMPTWQVQAKIIKPQTEERRCRYTELGGAAGGGTTGPADVFASHCWGASWGDLVAALADGASPSRRVWIDIFAVRQW